MFVMEANGRGRKQGNLEELNLEALSEPCRLLLLASSLNTSKEAIKKILISIDKAPWILSPGANCPFYPSLSAALAPYYIFSDLTSYPVGTSRPILFKQ